MNTIIFYSTHCPKCKVVEMKLKQKHIAYTECDDINEMMKLGIQSAPCLGVNGKILPFAEAVNYINSL